MLERPEVPLGSSATTSLRTRPLRWTGSRPLLAGVALLILGQLLLRSWVAGERGLYGDDLHYGSRAMELPLFSSDLLLAQHGGHFMPAALLLDGVLTRLGPLEWWPMAAALIGLQALASLAVLRLLRLLLGDRPALLAPLAVYLFSPLNLGFFAWWSAAMNSLPLQIGLAWVVGDAILLMRARRIRHAVTGTAALALTLAFYERAVLFPLLAFALVALLLHAQGVAAPLRAAWQRARALWVGTLLVTVGWAWAFTTAVPSEAVGSATVAQVAATTKAALRSPLPALLGGPWSWTSGPPDTPHAAAPPALTALSAVVLLLVVGWTSWRRRGAVALWFVVAAYALAGALLVALGRGSFGVGELLPLTYRYFAAEVVLLAVALAVVISLPARTHVRGEGRSRPLLDELSGVVARRLAANSAVRWGRRLAAPVLTVLFIASSVVSTVSYVHLWSENRTPEYLATVKATLAAAADGEPLMNQAVPEDVLNGLFYPSNHVFSMFGPLEERPEFGTATHDLRLLDDAGELRPAQVVPGIPVAPGPAGCGWEMTPGTTAAVALEGSLFEWVWTMQLDYTATMDGTAVVQLGAGETVDVPVLRGSHTVYVRLVGAGDQLRVTGRTRGLGLCVGSGVLGTIDFAEPGRPTA